MRSRRMKTDSEALTPQQEAFIREYDASGNGTRAYMASHPECRSVAAAAVEAHRYLRKPKIKTRVDALSEARWKRLQMSGDEAAMLVACDARADIRELYDEKGVLLPVHLWPDSVARSVKAVRPGAFGTSVVLNDSLAARRIILEQAGRLKQPLAPVADLATLLAGHFKDGE
jgi:phage terminase small subunit